jgi:hypothetical protein
VVAVAEVGIPALEVNVVATVVGVVDVGTVVESGKFGTVVVLEPVPPIVVTDVVVEVTDVVVEVTDVVVEVTDVVVVVVSGGGTTLKNNVAKPENETQVPIKPAKSWTAIIEQFCVWLNTSNVKEEETKSTDVKLKEPVTLGGVGTQEPTFEKGLVRVQTNKHECYKNQLRSERFIRASAKRMPSGMGKNKK